MKNSVVKEYAKEIKKRHEEIQDKKKLLDLGVGVQAKIHVDSHIEYFLDEIAAAVEGNVNEKHSAAIWLGKIPRRDRKWYRSKTRFLTKHERDYLAKKLSEYFSVVIREDCSTFTPGGYYRVKVRL